MIDSPNTTTIQSYLVLLECCKTDAENKLKLASAAFTSAKDIHQSKQRYFDKLKSIWEKLKATNDKSGGAKQSIELAICVADNLKDGVCLDRRAIECLANEIIGFSHDLETYCTCVDSLIKEIEKIKKAKLDQGNSIIKCLKDLRTAYEEAIKAATEALGAVLAALECAYGLKLKLTGIQDGLLDKCPPPGSAEPVCPPSTLPAPDTSCLGELYTEDPSCNVPPSAPEFFKGLCQSLEMLKELFAQQFQLFTVDRNGTYTFLCQYAETIKAEMDKAEMDLCSALECMEKIQQELGLAQSRKEAAFNAWQAANNAKKC